MKHLLFILALSSCNWGPWKKDNQPSPADPIPALLDRVGLFCALSEQDYSDNLNVAECDGALFTSLHGLSCGYAGISQFQDPNGKLWRSPERTCFAEGRSASEFSKDMATGTQLYAAARPAGLERFIDLVIAYAEPRDWVVCDAKDDQTRISRCLMSPKIVGRWYDLQAKYELQDPDREADDGLPVLTGFQGHLQMLGILTEWLIYGGVSDISLSTIQKQASREPDNMLYQAMNARFNGGNQRIVAERLLNMFPTNRLPNNHDDWCSTYLFERDKIKKGDQSISHDWLPCPERELETHPGTDFLTAAWVLLHEP